MTPEIHEKYKKLKMLTDMLAPTLEIFRLSELESFAEEARIFSNGTLAPILLHSMSMTDLSTSEKNLKQGIAVVKCLTELCDLLNVPKLEKSEAA